MGVKGSIYLLLIAAIFALSSAHANNQNIPEERINTCRTDLKACQKLKLEVYFGYFECQYTYQACINNKPADLDKFHELISVIPETNWEVSTPEKEGIDPKTVKQAVEFAGGLQDLYSLLIVKNAKLVSESYIQLKDNPRPQYVASVTKSIVSLLIGIAIDKGYLPSEDITIKPYFKGYFSTSKQSLKEKIKIVDLLRMKSGLAFTDIEYWFTYDVKPGYTYTDFWNADNAKDYALQFDMAYKPGEKYQYNSPAVSLLTTILNHSTGMTADEFAKTHLFEPLGIKNTLWAHDFNEYYHGSHVIFMRPRALAKIGQMVLDNGVYDSKQIVSSSWIEKSFTVHQSDDVWESHFLSTAAKLRYGYLWYITKLSGYELRFAYGYGGNLIIIVPQANLLIVTTANPYVSFEKARSTPDKIFDGIVKYC